MTPIEGKLDRVHNAKLSRVELYGSVYSMAEADDFCPTNTASSVIITKVDPCTADGVEVWSF